MIYSNNFIIRNFIKLVSKDIIKDSRVLYFISYIFSFIIDFYLIKKSKSLDINKIKRLIYILVSFKIFK